MNPTSPTVYVVNVSVGVIERMGLGAVYPTSRYPLEPLEGVKHSHGCLLQSSGRVTLDTVIPRFSTVVVFAPEQVTSCWPEVTYVGIFALPPREALIYKESWCLRHALHSNKMEDAG